MRSLFLMILVAFLIAGCDAIDLSTAISAFDTDSQPPDTARIEYGIEVYRRNYCGSCHALEAANTRGTFGPAHDNAQADAQAHVVLDTYAGEADSAEAYIRESIVNPSVFYTPGYEATNHHMPAFSHLPEEDIEAMVYLLLNQ